MGRHYRRAYGYDPYYYYYPFSWWYGFGPSWYWGYYWGWWPGFNWYYWSGSYALGFGFYWPYYYSYGRYWPAYYAYWYPFDEVYGYGYSSYCPDRVVVYESYPSTVVVEGAGDAAPAPPAEEDPLVAGDVLLRAADYEGAEAAYRKVVEAEPDNSVAKFALTDALFALGRFHEAAYMARLGLTQDAGWLDAEVDKGKIFKDAGEFDRLLGRLEASASADAYDSALAFLLGYEQYFRGRFEEARASLERTLSILPGDRLATDLLEKIGEKTAEKTGTKPSVPQGTTSNSK